MRKFWLSLVHRGCGYQRCAECRDDRGPCPPASGCRTGSARGVQGTHGNLSPNEFATHDNSRAHAEELAVPASCYCVVCPASSRRHLPGAYSGACACAIRRKEAAEQTGATLVDTTPRASTTVYSSRTNPCSFLLHSTPRPSPETRSTPVLKGLMSPLPTALRCSKKRRVSNRSAAKPLPLARR